LLKLEVIYFSYSTLKWIVKMLVEVEK